MTDRPATEPRTEAGRTLLDASDVLLMMSGDEIIGLNEGELELHILAVEAEARQQGVNEVESILRRHLMAAIMPEKERNDD